MRSRLIIAGILAAVCLYFVYSIFFYVPEVHNFSDAKAVMEQYVIHDDRITIYCGARFDEDRKIELPAGFHTEKSRQRAGRMEWEHAVPVENFGRTFKAWREGHPYCQKEDGTPYRGRKCAGKVSSEFRKMESDLYNLFPSIGAVNAGRSNREYAELPQAASSFGSCEAKLSGRQFEPPARAKGQVARASLYMDAQYERFHLSRKQKQLFTAWSRQHPVDRAECRRTRRIERIQGNENLFVKEPCQAAGLW